MSGRGGGREEGNYGTLLNFQLPLRRQESSAESTATTKVGAGSGSPVDGRVGGSLLLLLLLLLFLLVRGKELFPERRQPRRKEGRKEEGRFPARMGRTARTKTKERKERRNEGTKSALIIRMGDLIAARELD